MGNTNFDLAQSIDDCVGRINSQGSISGSDAAELKAHLYDATDELKSRGLTGEEAFMVACKRLGNAALLTEEYAKVNTTVTTNKIWAYLLLGFNLFYSLPSLLFIMAGLFYYGIYRAFNNGLASTVIITVFHVLAIALVIYLVGQKVNISKFLGKRVGEKPVLTVALSFIPLLAAYLLGVFVWGVFKLNPTILFWYPTYNFHNDFIHFSQYMALMSMAFGVLTLIFTINKTERLTLRTLFEKPSTLFLMAFGFAVAVTAAATRTIHFGNDALWWKGLLLGLVYMLGSYFVARYNTQGSTNKYLWLFLSIGGSTEVLAGITADITEGRVFTPYFIIGMLLGVIGGKLLGQRFAKGNQVSFVC